MKSADSVQCLLLAKLIWQQCRSQAAALTQQLRVGGTDQTFWPKQPLQVQLVTGRHTAQWCGCCGLAAANVRKKAKPQTQEVASPTTHPHFTQYSGQNPVEAAEVSGYHRTAGSLWLQRSSSENVQTSSPITCHIPSQEQDPRQRKHRHREDAHHLGEYRAYSMTKATLPTEIPEVPVK